MTDAVLLECRYADFAKLIQKHNALNEEFQKYKLKVIKNDRKKYFDYIVVLPDKLTKKLHAELQEKMSHTPKLLLIDSMSNGTLLGKRR